MTGTLGGSTSNTQYRIEFFSSPLCDGGGSGEGEVILGAINVTTDAGGNATINAPTLPPVTVGQVVTATATVQQAGASNSNDTSQFSACRIVTSSTTISVTNTNDNGAGSLRQAIIDANTNAGINTITFNITGAGVKTISPTTPLPDITEAVIIDGYTQPGASVNTLAVGSNAVLLIELSGSSIGRLAWPTDYRRRLDGERSYHHRL